MITSDDVIHQQINQIDKMQEAFRNLNRILQKLDSNNCKNLINAIINNEFKAWRDLFLFSLSSTEEMREKIRLLAYDRFYREDMYVMGVLGGDIMSSHLVNDEKELRAMLKSYLVGC